MKKLQQQKVDSTPKPSPSVTSIAPAPTMQPSAAAGVPGAPPKHKPQMEHLLKAIAYGTLEESYDSPGLSLLSEVVYTLHVLLQGELGGADSLDWENAKEACLVRLRAAQDLLSDELEHLKDRLDSTSGGAPS